MSRLLLRALLALAPESFKSRYGAEVLEVHEDRRVDPESGRWFALGEVMGLAVVVARLRVAEWGRGVRGGRDGSARHAMEALVQDTRFALRTLKRNPGSTAAALAVLALGIGANTAIFSAANAYFFQPLPFEEEGDLVILYETNPEFGWTAESAAPANVLDWRDQVEGFDDVGWYGEFTSRVTLLRDGEPELLAAKAVSANFFDILGVPAALGRTFRWEENWDGSDGVVVLSHSLWQSHFGSDPSVVGRTVDLFGGVEVIGVMPAGFTFPDNEAQLWTTFGWAAESREAAWFRRAHFVRPFARLAPDITLPEADAQLQVVVRRLQQDFPETNRVMGAGMTPLRTFLVKDVRTPLLVLLGAVAVLLLLACANVANLALVRAGERLREVALRRALGAPGGRVVRQILTESLLLAAGGGAAGLALGWVGIRALDGRQPMGIDGATALSLDHRVVLFTVAATVASGLLFGLAPVLRLRAGDLQPALRDGGRGGTVGRRGLRAASTLVAAEVALALLLVVGAGLMVRSFVQMRSVDPGFRAEGALAVQFDLPAARYPERDDVLAFYDGFIEALEGRPGIETAGTVEVLPLSRTSWSSSFQAEGWPPDRVGFEILHRRADAGYFAALDIPLVRGRLFDRSDDPDGDMVVVVNETFARQHFPGEDPIGQRIAFDRAAGPESTWYEIVGIVGDQHQVSPRAPVRAEAFENRRQDWGRSDWIVLRTRVAPTTVVPAVRDALRESDPLIAIASVRTLEDVWRGSMAREEFILTLLGLFGALALVLAAVGVYGVTAQAARRRTQEIGIRMALGARGGQVLGLMLRQGLGVVAVGLAVGLVASLIVSRALVSLLFGVSPSDPVTLLAVVSLLGGVAALACYVPARRAAKVDPAESLRAE